MTDLTSHQTGPGGDDGGGVKDAAQERAQQVAGQARSTLRDQVDQRSTDAGQRVSSTAQDVRSVGHELRRQGKDGPAKVADQAAERADAWAATSRARAATRSSTTSRTRPGATLGRRARRARPGLRRLAPAEGLELRALHGARCGGRQRLALRRCGHPAARPAGRGSAGRRRARRCRGPGRPGSRSDPARPCRHPPGVASDGHPAPHGCGSAGRVPWESCSSSFSPQETSALRAPGLELRRRPTRQKGSSGHRCRPGRRASVVGLLAAGALTHAIIALLDRAWPRRSPP